MFMKSQSPSSRLPQNPTLSSSSLLLCHPSRIYLLSNRPQAACQHCKVTQGQSFSSPGGGGSVISDFKRTIFLPNRLVSAYYANLTCDTLRGLFLPNSHFIRPTAPPPVAAELLLDCLLRACSANSPPGRGVTGRPVPTTAFLRYNYTVRAQPPWQ